MELGDKKNSGKNLEWVGTFEVFIGRLSAISGRKPTIEISKLRDFDVFWTKYGEFAFQIHMLAQDCPEMDENDFLKLL